MKFVLEVDLDAGVIPDDVPGELGRILRYWGGATKQLEYLPGTEQTLMDSSYSAVGTWRITD